MWWLKLALYTHVLRALYPKPRDEQWFESVVEEIQDKLPYDFSNLEVYYQLH